MGRILKWMTGNPEAMDSASIAIIRAASSISSQKHLGQAPEGDGADQDY